jgi:2-desacetyl-2-hydroxyethyl bacteriochlorophyllide A dehydrogenase
MGPSDVEVEVAFSGISTGTERLLWDGTMPPFPGLSYPLVPGYESVGTVVRRGPDAKLDIGETVFVPGSYSFKEAANVFGGSAERLILADSRAVRLPAGMGARGVLLALAATAYHAMSGGRQDLPLGVPDLVIGHGVMGRLLARITLALGMPAPTVWETQPARRSGATGYAVVPPDDDARKDYAAVYDVSGDASLLNGQLGAFYNFIACISAFAMIPLARRFGAKPIHAVAMVASGLAMLAIATTGSTALLIVAMIGIGVGIGPGVTMGPPGVGPGVLMGILTMLGPPGVLGRMLAGWGPTLTAEGKRMTCGCGWGCCC